MRLRFAENVRSLVSKTTVVLTATSVVLFAMQVGCGSPRSETPDTPPPAVTPDVPAPPAAPELPDGVREVKGNAQFGVQCPYGIPDDPTPVKLVAVNCPLPVQDFELTQPLLPLMFEVDCQSKLITVRGSYRSMKDDTWGILPDNSFEFVEDAGTARLVSDGSGGSNCAIPLQVDLWGKVACSNATDDKATVSLEARWDAKVFPSPSPQPWTTPSPAVGIINMPIVVITPSPRPSNLPPSPVPVPSASPSPSPLPLISPTPLPSAPSDACNLPPDCYLYATVQVSQCQSQSH